MIKPPTRLGGVLRKGAQIGYAIYRRFFPVALSVDQRRFMERNAALWSSLGGSSASPRPGYVLVAVETHPLIAIGDAVLASIVARAKGARLLFLHRVLSKTPALRVLESYPGAEFHSLRQPRYALLLLSARWRARSLYRDIRTPEQLLDVRVDGIRFGDVLYDAVLARGYATVERIDRRVLEVLREFFFWRGAIRALLRRHQIVALVSGGAVGIQGATLTRYLLASGGDVFNRSSGSYQITVRKYRHPQDLDKFPVMPAAPYVRALIESDDETIEQRGREYIERRLGGELADAGADLAYGQSKARPVDREEFCAHYDLDPAKPIAFVMLHAFNDYIHSYFANQMIFKDYYEWCMATLDVARDVPSVNWIFKEHPYSRFYPTRDIALGSVFARLAAPNVRFLASDAPFSGRSVRHIADALVTCSGTAGLEYSGVGVPCVLAGRCWYSDFGFAAVASARSEYERLLRNIKDLRPLSREQIRAARIVMYCFLCLRQDSPYYFCPALSDEEIANWGRMVDAKFWKMIADRFSDDDWAALMKGQVADLSEFVSDDTWQYYVSSGPMTPGAAPRSPLVAGRLP